MFIDYTKYSFLNSIVENVDAIAREFYLAQSNIKELNEFVNGDNSLSYTHVDYWIRENKFHPEDIGYEAREGIWGSFPVYKNGFPINWYSVKENFPEIVNLLKHVPSLYFSSFMMLDAKAKATPHKHLMKNYIFHVLLHDLDAPCEFTVNGETKNLQKKGDALLFDYSLEHSTINYSTQRRFDFTIDFDPIFLNR